MTIYARTRNGEYSPASLISCSLIGCITQILVPQDVTPRQCGESFGWTYVENTVRDARSSASSFICHLHIIHPRLEIDETN